MTDYTLIMITIFLPMAFWTIYKFMLTDKDKLLRIYLMILMLAYPIALYYIVTKYGFIMLLIALTGLIAVICAEIDHYLNGVEWEEEE